MTHHKQKSPHKIAIFHALKDNLKYAYIGN